MAEFCGDYDAGLPTGELFELLTDALRAGPTSPAWAAALERIGAEPGADEYRMLLKARHRLEAGKSFRSLESSPQLAHAVMASISAEAARPRFSIGGHLPPRVLLAMSAVAAMLIITVGALVAEWMAIEARPAGMTLPQVVRHGYLAGYQTFELTVPDGWKAIGSLRVKADHGLRLAGGPKQLEQAGGMVWQQTLAANKPFRVQARIHYVAEASVSPEIFLTDDADFDDDRPAERNHEFAWTVLGDQPQVRTANRSLAVAADTIRSPKTVTVAIDMKFNGANASVETLSAGKCTNWTGGHLLDASKPWHMGVRFVVHGTRHDDCVALEAVRLAYQ